MLKPAAPQPDNVTLQVFFDDDNRAKTANLRATLRESGLLNGSAGIRQVQRIADPGWATAWQAGFKPMTIGRRLLIVPPWSNSVDSRRKRLVIQPAQAFGTGHHETTSRVLRI